MDDNFFDALFENRKAGFYREWIEFLQFKSISMQPDRRDDCRSCAAWLTRQLQGIGMTAECRETSTLPVVIGHLPGAAGKPRILFYGHYDVQPVDPLDQWESGPFEPEWRAGRLYARGAQDNKGQVMAFLKAVEVLMSSKALACPLTVVIEGEEEMGSGGFAAKLPEWGSVLRSDVLMASDTFQAARDVPAVIMGLRGVLALEVELGGIAHDLHSGFHGGLVRNPVTELARLLATLHHADGSIAVSGFYEGVEEPDPVTLEMALAAPFDAEAYEREVGVPPLGGEQRFAPKVRTGLRPCIELNGIYGGYSGPGMKTIIPAKATAKLSARLAGAQQPRRAMDAIVSHLERHAPPGLTLTIRRIEEGSGALHCRRDSRWVGKAQAVLAELFPHKAVLEWEGASIPILAALTEAAGAEPVLVGFGLSEDNIHAPNESYSEAQFKRGFMYYARMLASLSEGY